MLTQTGKTQDQAEDMGRYAATNDIDEIQDEELKNIVAEIFNGGFKLIALEGSFLSLH